MPFRFSHRAPPDRTQAGGPARRRARGGAKLARTLAVLLSLASLPGGCGPSAPPAPFAGQDCLVVVLDALDAGQLGCYGGRPDVSPTIDALAARGVRFAHARSNSAWTLPSTATLFTGLYAGTHGLEFGPDLQPVRLSGAADTLAELFAAAGYDTVYAGQNPFSGEPYGLEQGFAEHQTYRIWTEDMIEDLERTLSAPRERPVFVYAHLRRPHTPYDAAPEHRAPFVDPDYDGPVEGSDDDVMRHNTGQRRLEGADLEHMRDLYLANIRQSDAWLARLMAAVDTSRTLVLVLSDHGDAVGQHGWLGHNWHTWEEYVRIPLIALHPSLPAGTVVDAPVATVDLMPTLIDLFGLPRPAQPLQGRSLAAALTGAAPWPADPVFLRSRELNGRRESSVVDGRWKYTVAEPTGEERLIDLVDDPEERVNVAREQPDVAARLRDALQRWSAAQRPGYTTASEGIDEETRRHLQELGYVR